MNRSCSCGATSPIDADVRAVVLTGAGRAFSAGGSYEDFERRRVDFEFRQKSMDYAVEIVEAMVNTAVPVVGAVNGPAVGLGCSIATLCDVVFIADTAFLADPHVSVALVAGDGSAVTWPAMTSLMKAKQYLLTGDRIPATEAVALGLANFVVPPAELLADATSFAYRLAAQPPQAVQETKRILNQHLRENIGRALVRSRGGTPVARHARVPSRRGGDEAEGLNRGFARKAQHALANDVLVHFGGAAGDGHRARAQQARPPRPVERVHAEHVDRGVGDRLIAQRPRQLDHAALGAGRLARERGTNRSLGQELQVAHLDVAGGDGVARHAVDRTGDRHQAVELAPRCRDRARPRRRARCSACVIATRQPSLTAPSIAVDRDADVGEEDLGELLLAGDRGRAAAPRRRAASCRRAGT